MPIAKTPLTVEERAYFEKTIANATRLYDDSILLTGNERGASAIILAVFAIEELGKGLITLWGVRNLAHKRSYPTHIEKQSAVFALLSANELLRKNRRRMLSKLRRGDVSLYTMGHFTAQFAWARKGFFDDVRMAATYADATPKIPDELRNEFGPDLASDLHSFYRKAKPLIKNADAMNLAATIFENDLGRL